MKHMQMIIAIVCILYVTASCTTHKVTYRERFEEAKGYALYACIAYMNKFIDSTSVINKDYSGEYFVQLSRDIPKIIKFKATNSLRVSCLFCIFKHSPQKTV